MVAIYSTSSQSQIVHKGSPNLRTTKFTNLIEFPKSQKPTSQPQEEQGIQMRAKHPRDLGELSMADDSTETRPKQSPGESSQEDRDKEEATTPAPTREQQTHHPKPRQNPQTESRIQHPVGISEIAIRGEDTPASNLSLEPQQTSAAAKQHHYDKNHRPEKRYTTEEINVNHTGKAGKTARRLSQISPPNRSEPPESENAPRGDVRTKRPHSDGPPIDAPHHQLEKQRTEQGEVTRWNSGVTHNSVYLQPAKPEIAHRPGKQNGGEKPTPSKPRKRAKQATDVSIHQKTDDQGPAQWVQITNLSRITRDNSNDRSAHRHTTTSTSPALSSQLSAPGKLESATFNETTTPENGTPQRKQTLWPPTNQILLEAVTTALAWQPNRRTPPIFDFTMSQEAAEHNFQVLKQENFDLERLLLSDGRSPLMPGSEFRPVSLLSPIFKGHPHWHRLRRSLLIGATMELEEITEEQRLKLLDTALAYGNFTSQPKPTATTYFRPWRKKSSEDGTCRFRSSASMRSHTSSRGLWEPYHKVR